jgi:AcrR family transcriptional regulator
MTDATPLIENPDSSAEGKTTPRWQRRPDARPEEILRAAMQTFVERGFAATKLEEVAARAGVSKGTLYLYFSNKEDLFKSTVQESILPHIQSGEQRMADFHGSPLLLLREAYTRWALVVTDPLMGGLCKLIVTEAANFPDVAHFYFEEVIKRTRALFASILQRCMTAGELRELPIDLAVREITAPVLFAVMWRQSMSQHDDKPLDIPAYLTFHFNTLLQGWRITDTESDTGEPQR